MKIIFNLDTSLFNFFNSLIGSWPYVDAGVIFFAHYLTPILLAFVVFEIIRRDVFSRENLIRDFSSLVITLMSTYGLTNMLRELFGRVRPLWALESPHLLVEYSSSFPSAHTSFVFALGTFLYLFGEKKLAYVVYALGLFVGLGRVIAGVHYPFDIVGGAIVGTLIAWSVQFVLSHAPRR